jgi:hypothetical protein
VCKRCDTQAGQIAACPRTPALPPKGNDTIGTRNNIYLGQIGALSDWCGGNFLVTVLGKDAIGGDDETVKINGDQIERVVTFQTNDRPKVLFYTTDFWAKGISLTPA